MTLLREIQQEATSGNTKVSDLLRKTKILARRLKSRELEEWVNHELNGYYKSDKVPEYRIVKGVMILGDFIGSFGSQYKNIQISIANIILVMPGEWKEWTAPINIRHSIAECEHILNETNKNNENPKSIWPADISNKLSYNVIEGMVCIQAWRPIQRSCFERILDTVKNNILNFAMDIEEKNPNAGEAGLSDTPLPPQTVSHVFNQNFHSAVGNVAAGSTNVTQTASIAPVGQQLNMNVDMTKLSEELKLLRSHLTKEASEPEHYQALGEIASAEKAIADKDQPKMIQHLKSAGTWALNATTAIGTTLAAEVIKSTLGIGGAPIP
jgi:hypothetical protein